METFQAADVDRYHKQIIKILSRPDKTLPTASELAHSVRGPCEATINIGLVFANTFINRLKGDGIPVIMEISTLDRLKKHVGYRPEKEKIDETENWILANFFNTAMTEGLSSKSRILFVSGRNAMKSLNTIKYAIEEAENIVPHAQVDRLPGIWRDVDAAFTKYSRPVEPGSGGTT